ncbi:MAG: hypothetical protein mread185_000621 [Mycoplasmataceae bacterium]|nr:MAG: hypothetical protein mread185_000621 [Mycoplasmataceae bacterium]
MTELIIIKTDNSQAVRQALEEKHITFQIVAKETLANSNEEWNETEWREAVRLASQDKERNKEISAWDKIASKVKF